MLSYYILKALGFLACLLPRRAADAIGWGLGYIAWPFIPRGRRRLAQENIRRCLGCGEAEAARIAKASAVRFGPMFMEVLRFPVIEKHIGDYVSIEGLPYLQKAMEEGTGGIIATAHSGNWELMGGAFALAGIPLVGVAMKQKSTGADRFINEYRTLIGMHITYKSGVREMFDMLQKGWPSASSWIRTRTAAAASCSTSSASRRTACRALPRWRASRACRSSPRSCIAMRTASTR